MQLTKGYMYIQTARTDLQQTEDQHDVITYQLL